MQTVTCTAGSTAICLDYNIAEAIFEAPRRKQSYTNLFKKFDIYIPCLAYEVSIHILKIYAFQINFIYLPAVLPLFLFFVLHDHCRVPHRHRCLLDFCLIWLLIVNLTKIYFWVTQLAIWNTVSFHYEWEELYILTYRCRRLLIISRMMILSFSL